MLAIPSYLLLEGLQDCTGNRGKISFKVGECHSSIQLIL